MVGMTLDDPFAAAILAELAAAPQPGGMSLPRLAQHLNLSASVVLRKLSLMGDAMIAGQAGPGWVRVAQEEERWVIHLTAAGREAARSCSGGADAADIPSV